MSEAQPLELELVVNGQPRRLQVPPLRRLLCLCGDRDRDRLLTLLRLYRLGL